jgi:exopolysaccharide biosynthesis WecB/TagA/CpsF family protein
MLNLGKKNVIGIQIDAVDYEYASGRVLEAANRGKPLAVSALAVHGVMTGVLDPEHKYRLNSLDLVVPDGQPVRRAMNWLYRTGLKDRVYGPNLTLCICEQAAIRGVPVYFYGSRPSVLDALKQNLRKMYPGLVIAGCEPSLFRLTSEMERQAIVDRIKASGARIVFVGLGCPRQEVWSYEYRESLGMPLVAVGAAFDFHAGTLRQAPPLLQRAGLEWLYRLALEPRRLWKRYLLLNPSYLMNVLAQLLKWKAFDPSDAVRPTKNLNYG